MDYILDQGIADAKRNRKENSASGSAPKNATIADVHATIVEIYHAAADRLIEEGESILEFIEKTCVWCA